MRLATFEHEDRERFGLVVRHPGSGTDWIFDPAVVESVARSLPSLKGGGYTWWRPDFCYEGSWPETLIEFLRAGSAAMNTLRRLQDFLLGFLAHGDPGLLAHAGWPIESVALQAPIPEPPLLLGVVGNNAGFLRMDPARARNLAQPSCHQRTQTSIIGPGQPFVLPRGNSAWAGTTELGLVIGRAGRDIPRERAREHIAGYTVIIDAITFAPTDRALADLGQVSDPPSLDSGIRKSAAPSSDNAAQSGSQTRPTRESPKLSFHAANSASWLGKKADTMLAMGPWLVTPEDVGDPYDLLACYREGSITRNRAHSGAIVCGLEELIAWLSTFIELQPGMVLHLGAMGQDGVTGSPAENFGPDHSVEAEIERIGTLRNPLVAPDRNDWRSADDPSRAVHPVPLVRKLIARQQTEWDRSVTWTPTHARHFWSLTCNTRPQASSRPLAYHHPASALSPSGHTVRLPRTAKTITATCELAFVIGKLARDVRPIDVPSYLLGACPLLVLRDSSFADRLLAPHVLPAQMPELYARWSDGFNVVGPLVPLDLATTALNANVSLGDTVVTNSTAAYVHDIAAAVAELSAFGTLLPGDLISLGALTNSLTLPAAGQLSALPLIGALTPLGQSWVLLEDQRGLSSIK